MERCVKHGYLLDQNLNCCWRCVSRERDPPDQGASWWWITELRCHCQWPCPSPQYDYCMHCGLRMRELGVGRAA